VIKLTGLSIQKKIPVVIDRGNPADDDIEYQIENINICGNFLFNNVCDFEDFINMLKKK